MIMTKWSIITRNRKKKQIEASNSSRLYYNSLLWSAILTMMKQKKYELSQQKAYILECKNDSILNIYK
jgi:hypothetical protein